MTLNHLQSMSLSAGQTLEIPVFSEVIVNIDSANIRQRPGEAFPVIAQMDRGAGCLYWESRETGTEWPYTTVIRAG